MSNPYSVLGVPDNSSVEVCKNAYRELSKKYHPDSGGDAKMFAMVTEAWSQVKGGRVLLSKHRGGVTHVSVFSFRKTN